MATDKKLSGGLGGQGQHPERAVAPVVDNQIVGLDMVEMLGGNVNLVGMSWCQPSVKGNMVFNTS